MPEAADAAADYFLFILTAISASSINGATLAQVMRDLELAKPGLRAVLGKG